MAIPYGYERDFLFIFQTLAIFALAYVAFKTGQRSREIGFFSATTGMCLLLVGIAFLQVTIFDALFYAEDTDVRQTVTLLGDVFIMGGLVLFVIFVEIDQARRSPVNVRPIHPYRYTKLAAIMLAVLILLVILDSELRFLLFLLELFPAAFAARGFIRGFSNMEMVKRTNARRQFFIGLLLVGLSNFLPAFHLIFGFWIFAITSAVIVVGAFLMVSAWAHFPRLEDLQWMLGLDRLLVFDAEGGLPLFDHAFRVVEEGSSSSDTSDVPVSDKPTGNLKNLHVAFATGAMTGIDSLLGEILASKGHVKEIDYGEKKAIFYRGKQAIFMLVLAAPSQESVYRLEIFALSFEKQFATELVKNKTDANAFEGALSLLWKYFS